MAQYQVLYWRHIPAQVKAFEAGKRPVSRPLPDRFQEEIDRVAMQEGLVGNDDYLNQWQWSPKQEREGSAEQVAGAVAKELEEQWGLTH
ncbi:MAG: virulence factor [Acidobacteria bacterium]|nr:virulence factor [Acidobacteriota bacterium]